MNIISIPSYIKTEPELVAYLEEKLNEIGEHSYSVQYNTFTRRITFTQTTQGKTFHLLFEQTKNNCASVLGFNSKDKRGGNTYQSDFTCNLSDSKTEMRLHIQELSASDLA